MVLSHLVMCLAGQKCTCTPMELHIYIHIVTLEIEYLTKSQNGIKLDI